MMRRDSDLIKEILQNLRDNKDHSDLWIAMLIKDKRWGKDLVEYHLKLLHDDNYIEGIKTRHLRGDGLIPQRLTSTGHDYLEYLETPWLKKARVKVFDFSGNIIQIALTAIITALVTYYFAKYIGAC